MILTTFACKRSGQHAIITWLCKQLKPSIHFNNCAFADKGIRLRRGQRVTQYNGGTEVLAWLDNRDFYDLRDLHMRYGELSYNRLHVFSLEDKEVGLDVIKDARIVLIVRSPMNMFASRKGHKPIKKKQDLWDVWEQHISMVNHPDIVTVHFDEWTRNKDYRKGIANHLGIDFTDEGREDISYHGISTFDGRKYDGKASQMNVLNRYETLTVTEKASLKKYQKLYEETFGWE